MRLVLASASPARLQVLRAAGLDPDVVVSGVNEDDVTGTPREVAATLAMRKASAVAEELVGTLTDWALIIGCDSVLDVDGQVHGKPLDAAQARDRWHRMRGSQATLLTGHHVRSQPPWQGAKRRPSPRNSSELSAIGH